MDAKPVASAVASANGTATAVGAGATESGGGGGDPNRPPAVILHNAPDIDVFYIREDQLAMLATGKRDNLVEFGWAMAALAGGAAPSAIPALWGAYFSKDPIPLSGVDLIQLLMVVGGVVAGLVALVVILTRGHTSTDIGKQVRSQKEARSNGETS